MDLRTSFPAWKVEGPLGGPKSWGLCKFATAVSKVFHTEVNIGVSYLHPHLGKCPGYSDETGKARIRQIDQTKLRQAYSLFVRINLWWNDYFLMSRDGNFNT